MLDYKRRLSFYQFPFYFPVSLSAGCPIHGSCTFLFLLNFIIRIYFPIILKNNVFPLFYVFLQISSWELCIVIIGNWLPLTSINLLALQQYWAAMILKNGEMTGYRYNDRLWKTWSNSTICMLFYCSCVFDDEDQ